MATADISPETKGLNPPADVSESTDSNITPLSDNLTGSRKAEHYVLDGTDASQLENNPHADDYAAGEEKPCRYLLRFGPWWDFCSADDRNMTKSRVFPSIAATLMPITVLFVLTSVEGNWIQSGPGSDGQRIQKPGGYVAGNAVATALAFLSAVTIAMRQADACRRFFSLRIAALIQIAINVALGAVCVVVGVLYQYNVASQANVWITPEYPCIYVGACLALFQAALLIADYLTTPNFNSRGHGFGSAAMQAAIGLANLVAIWTGFGALIFSLVEDSRVWHSYNSCFSAWALLITTGSTALNYETTSSKLFVFFWLPIGVLLLFVFFWCFGFGVVHRFDEKPKRRIRRTEEQLRLAYRELRHAEQGTLPTGHRVEAMQQRLVHLHDQRLRYFVILFAAGVTLKVCSWALGSIAFALTESGWSYWDAMVFLFLNLLTVGRQGMVPESPTGTAIYLAFTFVDLLATAAVDALLLHILLNLVPWPRYRRYAKSIAAAVTAKIALRRRRRQQQHRQDDTESESRIETDQVTQEEQCPDPLGDSSFALHCSATDQLENAISVVCQLRALLVRNAASEADLNEYDRLLAAVEHRADAIHLSNARKATQH
ncbi:Potassium channel [Coemansia sp. RSA 1813]|nr:Potassium channel [Coemansia sp. RSA 1646]KAJ1769619.1 Potassium channel [Coemansia sp. RSA 1843]KAJ2091008.1 Potassium channel [Coemansia sp. RSA 986]KAJ2215919.1 Potassium channel [Coemansia sp. RSA 487]KAJ2570239.1 Potassium channel [Coemansia sp. RSA 1813]